MYWESAYDTKIFRELKDATDCRTYTSKRFGPINSLMDTEMANSFKNLRYAI